LPSIDAEAIEVARGEIRLATTVDAIVLREELLLTAPASGNLTQLVAGGKRVRSGTPVASVGGAKLIPELPGNVVWEVDGLEGVTTSALKDATPAWFTALPQPEPRQIADGSSVQAGAPIGRLVVGSDRVLVALVPASAIPRQWDPGQLRVAIPSQNWTGSGAGVEWKGEGAERLLILHSRELPESLAGVRKVRLDLTFAAYTGTIVPRTAVDVRDGKQGVWIVKNGQRSFLPGAVIGGDATSVAMKLTVESGARVLKVAPSHLD
jgi:putative membrane fusion protein